MTRYSRHISNRRRPSRPGQRAAFTLIETILALTIFSFIAVGVSTSFFSGVKLWGRAVNTDSGRNNIMLNFESVSKELRQAIDLPAVGFAGDAKSFSFAAVSGDDVMKISYSYDEGGKMLSRKESKFSDVLKGNINSSSPAREIMSLDGFSVQYLGKDALIDKPEWRSEWKKDHGVFTAIRFTYKAGDEEFKKTVFIPIAQ